MQLLEFHVRSLNLKIFLEIKIRKKIDLVALSVPLHDAPGTCYVAYNFEANYNMPNQPENSFPGPPWNRWTLGSTYQDMEPKPDATPDDFIARNMKNETNEILRRKRYANSVLLTRRGIYRMLETRISA
jgi:hypothetical protein